MGLFGERKGQPSPDCGASVSPMEDTACHSPAALPGHEEQAKRREQRAYVQAHAHRPGTDDTDCAVAQAKTVKPRAPAPAGASRRTMASPSRTRRAAARRSANASSAVGAVRALAEATVSQTPLAVHVDTYVVGTLKAPAITFNCGKRAIVAASTRSGINTISAATPAGSTSSKELLRVSVGAMTSQRLVSIATASG